MSQWDDSSTRPLEREKVGRGLGSEVALAFPGEGLRSDPEFIPDEEDFLGFSPSRTFFLQFKGVEGLSCLGMVKSSST